MSLPNIAKFLPESLEHPYLFFSKQEIDCVRNMCLEGSHSEIYHQKRKNLDLSLFCGYLFTAYTSGGRRISTINSTRRGASHERKYLHRVMVFLGADVVFYGNDVVTPSTPEEVWDGEIGFFMPPFLGKELIKPPDYEKFPELKEIEELEGIIW